MPVLYFTQVLGWALGGDTGALGFGRAISGRKTIRQWFPKHPAEKEAYA
jgi:heterodisulfide reductase subunit B